MIPPEITAVIFTRSITHGSSGKAQRRHSYLLEDFLLLDRGESLWEAREDVSLEYERSERSDLSERGDDDRPLLLLLRAGLADPL